MRTSNAYLKAVLDFDAMKIDCVTYIRNNLFYEKVAECYEPERGEDESNSDGGGQQRKQRQVEHRTEEQQRPHDGDAEVVDAPAM